MKTYYWVSDLINFFTTVGMGSLVLLKDPHKKLYRTFAFFCGSIALWAISHMVWQLTDGGLRSLQSLMLGAIWVPTAFFHYYIVLLNKDAQYKWLIVTNYIFSGFFSISDFTSYYFIADVAPRLGLGLWPVPGPLFNLHLIMFLGMLLFTCVLLVKEIKLTEGLRQMQLKYSLAASLIAYAGGLPNYLPCYGFAMKPWANALVSLYVVIIAYSIIKHRLMDIEIVVRKTLLSSLMLILGIGGYIVFVVHFTHRGIIPLANFSILTAVLSVAMALFVVMKAPNKKITILWSLTCLSIATWSFGFGMMTRSQSFEACIFWQKWFLYSGAIFIPVLYLHFVSLLVGVELKQILAVSYLLSIGFLIADISGHLVSASIKPPFNYYTDAIFPIYHAYAAFFFVLAIYAHWLLLKRMKTAQGALKNQIQYVFMGTSIGFLGGCMTFPLSFNIHIFPIGTYLVAFYLLAVTYAIYRHRLMDINIVLRKSLVYSLMTIVLTAIYLVAITQGAQVMQNLFGASTLTVSIITACFISAVFLPLRNWVQSFVDRYFFSGWADQPVAREIAAGFSHELKSPLAGLSMQAQLALMELEEVEAGRVAWMKALPKIKEELQYLINQAMDAARRIEAVRGVAEPTRGQLEAVVVPDLIEQSLTVLRSMVASVDVAIKREFPASLSSVYGDAKQLEIVFINLMKNALQAMDGLNGGTERALFVSGREMDGLVLISIKDTGPGIAAKDINRIFEPYYTTKGHKGTGMGLYLAHQIIKAHGGAIEVKSIEGKGTEFIVRLPKNPAGVRAA